MKKANSVDLSLIIKLHGMKTDIIFFQVKNVVQYLSIKNIPG